MRKGFFFFFDNILIQIIEVDPLGFRIKLCMYYYVGV